MPLEPNSLLAGKYRIESVIGQGAYGRVYRARDIALERTVAIKEALNQNYLVQVYVRRELAPNALHLVVGHMGTAKVWNVVRNQARDAESYSTISDVGG